ncbi:MAG: prepilin-type N-terminal cleavage/methylation domain-containing protein [Phycisphaera sp.]|nr:prepilin-type N-terminal cleavage/methylation domain-containing protein [Phycisphaera sp.]
MDRASHTTRDSGQRARRRGFTLTEMLVVIVILLVLLGIGVTVGTSIIQEQEKQLTRETLKQCELIAAEYQVRTGGVPAPPGADSNGNGKIEISEFVTATAVDLQDLYKNFDADIYKGGKILDAWGADIRYNYSGRANPGDFANREHNTYFFMSIGPDNQPGNMNQTPKTNINYIRYTDNIYSMDVGN